MNEELALNVLAWPVPSAREVYLTLALDCSDVPEPLPLRSVETGDLSLPARWSEIQAIWDELAAELSPQQRAAFVLREIEELPVREVAEALGCGTSTVRSHISLARKTLQAGIRRRYPGYELLGNVETKARSDVDSL